MNKLKPALLGGLIVGILSAIPFLNYCCCIWGMGGGVLAGFLYIKSSPIPVKVGEGAVLGVLTGIVGAVLYFIIGVPIAYFLSGAQLEETLVRAGRSASRGRFGTPAVCAERPDWRVDTARSRGYRWTDLGTDFRETKRWTAAATAVTGLRRLIWLTNDLRKTGFRRN